MIITLANMAAEKQTFISMSSDSAEVIFSGGNELRNKWRFHYIE